MMGCTEEQRFSYSAFLLKYHAKDWCKAHQRAHSEGVIWAEFKREFTERFFLKAIKMPKLKSFIDWSRGTPLSQSKKRSFQS